MKAIIAVCAVLTAAFVLAQTGSQNQQVQFEKALALEEAQGKLQEAMALYQKIVDGSKDQALAAQAQLRIGICHQKLGHKEAQSAFQKVIDNYPGQPETVRLAREQLSMLLRAQTLIEKGDKEYKITKIHTDTRSGRLSPDGTSLAFIDSKCLLSLRNVASGKEVCLVSTPFSQDDEIYDFLWSPDSKLIAYLTLFDNVGIVSTDGGQPQKIIGPTPETKKAGQAPYPMGWTSDSKKLIFQVSTRQSHEGLYAIPVSGGEWEEIYKFPDPQKAKERNEWLTLSPDGELIAYESTQGGNTDIFVMPARGGDLVRITDDPADDWGPRWSYDGHWLAFASNRTEDELWVIRITPDGKPGSKPIRVARGFEFSGTWTQDHKIAYFTETVYYHVFAANTDGSQEIKLTRLNQHNSRPRWSPDGKNVVFAVPDYGASHRMAVLTVPANGGDEKFLAYGTFPVWSPDGKEIAFVDEGFFSKAIISVILADGGKPREIMNYDGYLGSIDWSPDGREIAFGYGRAETYKNPIPDRQGSETNIYTIPVTGGKPKRLTGTDKKKVNFIYPRWSPDGKRIAFSLNIMPGIREPVAGIYTISVDGGEPKLVTDEGGAFNTLFCWSRDGKSIIFTKKDKESEWGLGLYRVSAEGGKPEKLNITGNAPDLSPDGKRIVFYRRTEARKEFWLAENFLPVDKGGK